MYKCAPAFKGNFLQAKHNHSLIYDAKTVHANDCEREEQGKRKTNENECVYAEPTDEFGWSLMCDCNFV